MGVLSKFVAAAALTVATTGSAMAATLVDVAVSGDSGVNDVTWDGTAPGEGTLTATATTIINFDDALLNDGLGQQAILTIVASTGGGGALATALPNFTQTGLDGYFEFRALDNTLLLRGDFTHFWLTGIVGDMAGNLTSVGGRLDLSSDVVDLSFLKGDNSTFGWTNIHPAYGITGGQLNDFQANNVTGTFGGVVPEPAAWAMMILGFGGMGVLLRRRRTAIGAATA
jgi:hypothetical protein